MCVLGFGIRILLISKLFKPLHNCVLVFLSMHDDFYLHMKAHRCSLYMFILCARVCLSWHHSMHFCECFGEIYVCITPVTFMLNTMNIHTLPLSLLMFPLKENAPMSACALHVYAHPCESLHALCMFVAI